MDRKPQPLSYKELAKGALYNAAESSRQETRPVVVQPSFEHLQLHDDSRDSVADLTSGHLYNPTSSVHEVDPPTWPAYGMQNVGSSTSPFRSYRLERPPSPKLAKRYSVTYQGRRPSHHTVAAGALFNPYVAKRLPEELDTEARIPMYTSAALSRTEGKLDHVYQPEPRPRVPLNNVLGLSTSGSGSLPQENNNTQNYAPPGSHHPSAYPASASRQASFRSNASATHQDSMPNASHMDPSMYIPPAQSRSRSDDTIYYHPSRENSVHRVPPPLHGDNTAQYSGHAQRLSRASSLGQGSTIRPTPWMQQEDANAAAFESFHSSRAHSPTGDSMHHLSSREHSIRGPSSLHNEWGDPASQSAHPSRAPSRHDTASAHMSFGAQPSSLHPSRTPTVIRDSAVHEDFGWGDPSHVPEEQISWNLSRAPTVAAGSIRAVDSIKNFKTSRNPSATTHVSRFQDQNAAPSRSPSAASRASQIQRHVGGSRAGTPDTIRPTLPIHKEEAVTENFSQSRVSPAPSISQGHDDAPIPIPMRAPSLVDDAASHRSRGPRSTGGASRAPSALGQTPSQHTLTRRGRASRLGRGSGRITPVASPEPPNSGSVYRISVVNASDDGKAS